MGWPQTASFAFRFYSFLQARFTNHSIIATRAIDLSQSEAAPPRIHLADAIKGFTFGPEEITRHRFNQEQVFIPPVFASVFSNVIIHSNATAIYDPDQKRMFLQRIQHPDENRFYYHHNHLAAFNGNFGILRFPQKIDQIACGIFLSGTGCFNYYHYLLEFLSKSEFIPKIGEQYREYPLLVHPNAERINNFREFLKLANHQSRKVVVLSEESAYQVESLVQISHLSIFPFNLRGNVKFKAGYFFTRPSTVTYLRNLALPKALRKNKPKKGYQRIFLSRKQVGRRTYNQDEVFAIAQNHGFEEIYIEDYDIYDQAYIFNQANLIVGPAGAAWTNLLFANKGAKGLSWMAEKFGDLSVYSNIAKIVGFDLFYIITPNTPGQLHASFHLDPNEFEAALIELSRT